LILDNSYKYICCIILIFFFVITKNNFAQNYEPKITKITDEKGNSPSATFSIVEDSVGFIWFGTVDGLHRYDGYNFKSFRHHEDDTNSLSNNTIRDIAISADQKMWIATSGGGLNCLDLKSEKITRYIQTGAKIVFGLHDVKK